MVSFGARQLIIAFLIFVGAAATTATAEVFTLIFILIISLLLSSPIYKWLKKTLIKPILVWDIHGVFITGDLELENLYEIKGTKDLIARVRNNYYVVALTNFNPELFSYYSKKWHLFDMYDELYNSGDLKARKPSAEAFERFFKRSGIFKKDIIFIDDRAENVDSARKLGIKSIQFKDSVQTEKALNDLGVKTR